MHEQSHPAEGTPHLTDSQAARVDYARRGLAEARAADLADLTPAGLILLVERLRGSLDDVLNVITETYNEGHGGGT